MSWFDHEYVIGDAGPTIDDTITDESGAAVDLTEYTVTFTVARASSGQVVVEDRNATKLNQTTDRGGVRYVPTPGDMTLEGLYLLEWRLGPTEITVPTRQPVRILARLRLGA